MALLFILISGRSVLAEESTPTNRLAGEKSPYLLQHAQNPVDWYPWGEAAFEKARKEEKPILLSVGYSTCHWCHVMERESFKNKETAAYLNEHFVAIKLDREERPDLDAVYMKSFQAMMGQGGGWPLNVFLTPELNLFYGGTYYPPEPRQGRPSFLQVLEGVERAWREDRNSVVKSAGDLTTELQKRVKESRGNDGELGLEVVSDAVTLLASRIDDVEGGWGDGPKFPQPSHLLLLLTSEDEAAREKALLTCRKMARGGIHDLLGGGFHRYATDRAWLIPHFEKMLYDQGQLLEIYCEAWRLTGEDLFQEAARGIADYVMRELQGAEGGYYSAQDAQSEGKEGKYWTWTLQELGKHLGPGELAVVTRVFGLSETGNFYDFSDPEALKDLNIISMVEQPGADAAVLAAAIAKMKMVRTERVPPMTDDKILAGWNGLMIGPMAGAALTFGEPRYLASAKRAYSDVLAKLWDGKRLANRWREGDVEESEQSINYLAMAKSARMLYGATLEKDYLSQGIAFLDEARERFFDSGAGGFFDGAKREDLVMRLQDDYDSAMPTPSSLGAQELVLYAEITDRADFAKDAALTFQNFGRTLREEAFALPGMTRALHLSFEKPPRLVIAGEGEQVAELLKAAWQAPGGDLVILGNTGPVSDFTKSLVVERGVKAFYCVGMTCREPTDDVARVSAWLSEEKQETGSDE